jgi:hypothetical protein
VAELVSLIEHGVFLGSAGVNHHADADTFDPQ